MAVRRLIITAIATGALLVPASAAFAGDATVAGYSNVKPESIQVMPSSQGPCDQNGDGASNGQPCNNGPAPQNLVAANQTQSPPPATPAPATVESSGSLPFTGLDVRVILLAAIVLGGVGLGLRRLSRHGA